MKSTTDDDKYYINLYAYTILRLQFQSRVLHPIENCPVSATDAFLYVCIDYVIIYVNCHYCEHLEHIFLFYAC